MEWTRRCLSWKRGIMRNVWRMYSWKSVDSSVDSDRLMRHAMCRRILQRCWASNQALAFIFFLDEQPNYESTYHSYRSRWLTESRPINLWIPNLWLWIHQKTPQRWALMSSDLFCHARFVAPNPSAKSSTTSWAWLVRNACQSVFTTTWGSDAEQTRNGMKGRT